jgi:cell division transport system permease protein
MPGVAKVNNDKPTSNRILRFAHWVEAIFLIAVTILLVSASLLIANTIRLSIFSRRREIEVMKLVGATNWFVRGPFMLEGLFTGLIGALLAIFFLILGKAIALPSILPHLSTDPTVHALSFPLVALILLGMGLVLGAVGSGFTIRRFLRV